MGNSGAPGRMGTLVASSADRCSTSPLPLGLASPAPPLSLACVAAPTPGRHRVADQPDRLPLGPSAPPSASASSCPPWLRAGPLTTPGLPLRGSATDSPLLGRLGCWA